MSTADDLSLKGMPSEEDATEGSRLGSEASVVRFAERILIELMTSDRKLKASREGAK